MQIDIFAPSGNNVQHVLITPYGQKNPKLLGDLTENINVGEKFLTFKQSA